MMKFEKKLYSIVLAVAMLFALVLPASAKSDDETANIYIAIVDGYDKAVSEAEFFTIKEQIKNGTLDKEAFIESALKNRSSIEVSYFPVEIVAASPVPRATPRGFEVDVFEALHEIGGVLKYGIPEFRLPNSVVDAELDGLRAAGVRFHTDTVGIQLTFGPQYGLTIQSEPDAGTTVSIRLPALGEAEVRRERREQP